MKNYYEILEIEPNCTFEEIKKSYLSLMKKYHPDTYQGDKKFAEQQTEIINEAYTTLKNEETRKKYDSSIKLDIKKSKNTETKTNIDDFINKVNSINKSNKENLYKKQKNEQQAKIKEKKVENSKNANNSKKILALDIAIFVLLALLILFFILCFKK